MLCAPLGQSRAEELWPFQWCGRGKGETEFSGSWKVGAGGKEPPSCVQGAGTGRCSFVGTETIDGLGEPAEGECGMADGCPSVATLNNYT